MVDGWHVVGFLGTKWDNIMHREMESLVSGDTWFWWISLTQTQLAHLNPEVMLIKDKFYPWENVTGDELCITRQPTRFNWEVSSCRGAHGLNQGTKPWLHLKPETTLEELTWQYDGHDYDIWISNDSCNVTSVLTGCGPGTTRITRMLYAVCWGPVLYLYWHIIIFGVMPILNHFS